MNLVIKYLEHIILEKGWLTSMPDDYDLLGVGGLTSLVTRIEVSLWGSEITFSFVYDPTGERLPYTLTFQDCQDIEWTVHDSEEIHEKEADLIGITLGRDEHRESATIHTNIFEISVLYRSLKIDKDGRLPKTIEEARKQMPRTHNTGERVVD